MNLNTKAGLNAGAPITQTDDRGSVRREAPAGIEPANSGFAERSPGGDVTRDGRDAQQTGEAGSAVGGGAGAPAGDGMPGSMPVSDEDPRDVYARFGGPMDRLRGMTYMLPAIERERYELALDAVAAEVCAQAKRADIAESDVETLAQECSTLRADKTELSARIRAHARTIDELLGVIRRDHASRRQARVALGDLDQIGACICVYCTMQRWDASDLDAERAERAARAGGVA
jgi:hypothetical protein